MADFRKMTVEALRRAAARLLGRGRSRLRTRRALVEALEAAAKGGKARKAGERSGAPARKRKRQAARPARAGARPVRASGKAGGRAGRKAAGGARPGPQAGKRPGRAQGRGGRGGKAARAARTPAAAPLLPRPDPEGHFVARVRGEEEARRAPHPMTEAAVESEGPSALRALGDAAAAGAGPADEEGLGDLPWSYQDDVLVALPRDPRTLFLYWDHAQRTLEEAFDGLEEAAAQLWLFALGEGGEWERLRAVDFALESRSHYLHGLEPGRTYRAEIHLVDQEGRTRLLARASNEVRLPNLGPSPVVDDRFARIPWDLPLARWLRELWPGGPFSEEARALFSSLSDWSRFAGRAWSGSAGGQGGRPFSPAGGPSSPAGAAGGREGP